MPLALGVQERLLLQVDGVRVSPGGWGDTLGTRDMHPNVPMRMYQHAVNQDNLLVYTASV